MVRPKRRTKLMTVRLKDIVVAGGAYVLVIMAVLYVGKLWLTSSFGEMKTILFWTPFWDRDDFYFGYGWRPFHQFHCPVAKCITTSDRSLLNYSDAVIIHINNITDPSDLPATRLLDQWWLYVNMEPPTETRADLTLFDGYFNTSLSYRKDSTFYNPYGKLLEKSPWQQWSFTLSDNYAKGKTGVVTWLVSHCGAPSGRDWYALELGKYVQVDIYGKCGTECPEDCDQFIAKTYKFFLALENNICKDYITEKPWYAMQQGLVPIVMGGGDYKNTLPAHSYIDIMDFPSPRELAVYLTSLHQNDTLYNEYFRWKVRFDVRVPNYLYYAFCDICEFLHKNSSEGKAIENLFSWYGDLSGASVCRDPADYFSHIKGFAEGYRTTVLARQGDN